MPLTPEQLAREKIDAQLTFHRPETLAEWAAEPDTLRRRLAKMPFAHPLATAGMRDCQVEAITNLEKSFAADRPRALIQMATDAGKTFAACAFTWRLIKHAGARRILFLVDRADWMVASNKARVMKAFAEQKRIVAEVERRPSVVEELEAVVSANLQRPARLRQSILQKAFSGELL